MIAFIWNSFIFWHIFPFEYKQPFISIVTRISYGTSIRQCCKNTFEFVQIALFLAHYTINEWRLYRFYRFYRLYRLYSCSAWYDDSKRQLWIHNVHCSCWYQKWYPNPIQTIWSVKRKITHIRYNSSNQRIEQFYLIC